MGEANSSVSTKLFYKMYEKEGAILLKENSLYIDDNEIKFDFKKISPQTILVRLNNENFKVYITEESSVMKISVNGKEAELTLKSSREQLLEKAGGTSLKKRINNRIVSPMPGIIAKVCKKEGEKALKGEVLLVLEAMKMENEIKAEHDLVVRKISITEKQSVEKGQLLIELDEG